MHIIYPFFHCILVLRAYRSSQLPQRIRRIGGGVRHRSQAAGIAGRRVRRSGLHCGRPDSMPDILHVRPDEEAEKVGGAEGRWSGRRRGRRGHGRRHRLHERGEQWQCVRSQHRYPEEGLQEGGPLHRPGLLTRAPAGRIYPRGPRDHRVICCRRLWHHL